MNTTREILIFSNIPYYRPDPFHDPVSSVAAPSEVLTCYRQHGDNISLFSLEKINVG
jgi:hypothetical protein